MIEKPFPAGGAPMVADRTLLLARLIVPLLAKLEGALMRNAALRG